MPPDNINTTLSTLFELISKRQTKATSAATAAQGIISSGNYDSVFRAMDDADPLLYEADRLFSAANIIRR